MNRFFRRFSYAGKGLRTAFSEQFNLKVHTMVAIVVIAAGFHFNLTSDEWLAIIKSSASRLAARRLAPDVGGPAERNGAARRLAAT